MTIELLSFFPCLLPRIHSDTETFLKLVSDVIFNFKIIIIASGEGKSHIVDYSLNYIRNLPRLPA